MKLDTPLIKVIRASRRLNIALFGVLPLLLVLGGVLYWGAQRILQQEEEKLRIDFSVLVGYIHAHETVLQSLHAQGLNPDGRRLVSATPVRETPGFDRAAGEFFDGQHAIAAMPFSLLCQSPDGCPVVDGVFTGIGGYLSDFYSTRWAASVYPAAPLFIISPSQQLSVSVPAISTVSGFEPLTRQTFLSVVDAVRQAAGGADPEDRSNGEGPRVTWLRDADLPDMLIGMLPVTLPLNTRDGTITTRRSVYAVSLLSRGRVSISEQVLREPLYDQFWLQHKGTGVLIGEGPPPAVGQPGFHFGGDGLVLRIADRTDSWTGYYKLNYGSFFRANMWLPITVLLMLGLGLAAGAAYLLWYNRRVIHPAEIAHLDMVESEEFNRTVLDTAPVALCVLSRLDGRVVFGNALAIQWLGIAVGEQPQDSPEANKLLRQVLGAARPGTIETFRTHEGRPLFVAFAPTRYKKQDVVLCAFADISARAEMEHTLAQAKQQADRANEAKSTFLATMSHEIRTPLYGVLGTLEVLSLTHLDDEQRRHVDRIQDSSVILQQLISDILDITKIESGQLALEMDGFDPRELVQHCVASYAGMAEQKGLVIYSCIDTSTPAWVVGDGGRIRQILNNLVNNAIKFTDSGHVVARSRAEVLPDGRARLHFQVVDSGVGISAENQVCLFEPFYQIDSGSHLVRGAGIGLSICARLAELMGSTIQVTSELGLGSSFSIAIDLDTAEPPPGPSPRLDGLRVYVRSARKELSENICQWLAYWGAQASVAPAAMARDEDSDGVLVDVHIVGDAAAPTEWRGPVVSAGGRDVRGTALYRADRHYLSSIGFALERWARGDTDTAKDMATPHYAPLNLRILVAEDNPINQVTMCDQLEQLGCQVTVAPDGAEALAQWNIEPFDVVLTDVNMPRMNGYELAGALRAQGVTVPIIGVTANALKDEEARCKAAGMSNWLVKPIKLSLLWSELRAVRGEPAAPRAADGAAQAARPSGAPPIVGKYREVFLETMTQDLARMEQAEADGNARDLRAVLHRMRGGFAAVQAMDLYEQAESAEDRLVADGLNDTVRALLTALAVSLRQTLAAL
ncbi:hybrid sensor histidine kinase/response regulator [Achromobacter xylosoxidans]|uniref:hybrid sensor histidine kinase/response regulator n=1 Tax=Alcaligenes xylosoxydans xylosoxydans TaxID=85698 RepID=UPI001F13C582|nr:hybrid sensor histidine kinase/response regulator [Achromobacter xylosoxidans]